MPKKILIICYYFPPYPGTGGRRWAKFAKYFALNGFEVFVISAKKPVKSGESLWSTDIDHPNIHNFITNSGYKELKPTNNLIRKVLNRFHLWNKKRKVKGTIYDRGIFWKKTLLEKATALIHEHDIKLVAGTGEPFHALHHMLSLKENFPDIKLIADFRDPWTTGLRYGFANMEPKRLQFEQQLERDVLEQSDLIIGPYANFLDDILHAAGQLDKYKVLPHAYDPDDYPEIIKPVNQREVERPLKLIYGGTLYPEMSGYLTQFLEKLRQHYEHIPLSIDFYTRSNEKFDAIAQHFKQAGLLSKFDLLEPKRFYEEALKADVILVVLAENLKDYLITKFVNAFPLQKKFLLLGPEGYVSTFIKQHKIGVVIDPVLASTLEVKQAIEQLTIELKENVSFDDQVFSANSVTQSLITYIEKL